MDSLDVMELYFFLMICVNLTARHWEDKKHSTCAQCFYRKKSCS